MDLVGGAVGSIIRKLGKLLQEEYRLQAGLPEQIESLKDELETAQTTLLTVGQVPPEQLDPQVRLWASKVREASYDMEDILDTFLVNVVVDVAAPAESKGGLRRRLQKKMAKLLKKTKARHTIASAIEDMKKRMQEVADRRDRYYVPVAVPVPATKPDPRLAHMHKEAAQLIGTDKARADLSTMLGLSSSSSSSSHSHGDAHVKKMKIVSVVGAGGLGKTTLARAVYDDLKPGYDCKAFVSVGRKPDLVQVFINIFFQLNENMYLAIRKVKDLQLLIDQLRKFLQNKRYFFVIDDVWDLCSWEIIKSALDKTNTTSGVMTTTRNLEVACSEEVYYLHPLSCDDSKKLFYMRLFGEGTCPVDEMDDVSDKILGKCGGVPLAIITMASLLVGKSKEDWFEVCNSPGFYHGQDNKQVDDTVWILSLSYYDLPSDLKTCLLYLSVYPEDCAIEKDSLIRRWIAEGFVEEKTGTSLFQRGEEYFHLLINRSLIEAVESKENGIIDGCRVHDMILDLICDLSYKENFIMISNDDRGISSRKKVRRLAHHYRRMNQSDQDNRMDMTQLRSFVANGCDIDSWVLHPTFKHLRVLALEGCTPSINMGYLVYLSASDIDMYTKGWCGLEHLGNLLHLRYLSLHGTRIEGELPEKIGALKLLQTLDLVGTGTYILPSTVSLLTQLVCLRADSAIAPAGFLGNFTSLEELQICPPDDEAAAQQFMEDLGHQSEIRSLVVQGVHDGLDSSMQSGLVKSLSKLQKLQRLLVTGDKFWGDDGTEDWDTGVLPQRLRILGFHNFRFRGLPSCINPAHLLNLSHLDICVANMDEAGLRALGGLPELHYLKLLTYASRSSDNIVWATVANIVAADGFFQKLKFFRLDGWMLHLVVSEDSTQVSFTIGKGGDAGAIRSKTRKDECRRVSPSAISVMPNLQELEFHEFVRALYKDRKRSCDNLFWECFPSLRKVKVVMHCKDAFCDDVDKEKAELKQAAELHPNRPMMEIDLRDEGEIHYWSSSSESDDDNNFSAQEREADVSAVADDEAAVTQLDDDDNLSASMISYSLFD